MSQPRPKIFISYSHKDEQEKDALLAQLRVLKQHSDVWHDDRIGAGENWEQRINETMEQATVAVLLITANFLTSDTIERLEVPKLLARHQLDGLPIVPIIARHCAWQEVDWLTKMNVRPKNGTPVWRDGGKYADEELERIAREVVELIRAEQRKRAQAEQAQLAKQQVEQERLARKQSEKEEKARLTTPSEPVASDIAAREQASQRRRWLQIGGVVSVLLLGCVCMGVTANNVFPSVFATPTPTRAANVAPTSIRVVPVAPTVTGLPPTITSTPVPPTITPTNLPTLTDTPRLPAATSTPTPIPPTATPTFVPPPTTPIVQRRGTDNTEMVFVSAGEFTMGSNDGENDEKPPHTVYLDAFWIDKYEVTNALYKKCVDAGKCTAPSSIKSSTRISYYGNAPFDNYPAIYVSWNSANAYCAWAGKHLPTEAQWEKAARGTDARTYPWGNTFDKDKLNSSEGGKGDTSAVGSYPAGVSPYGALDMSGNVYEWVADWYDEKYYSNSPSRNPTGAANRINLVLRGGSWKHLLSSARSPNRNGSGLPDGFDSYIGFRCAQ
jgi:formylglycine-generating enzyme required for sulfatase activity